MRLTLILTLIFSFCALGVSVTPDQFIINLDNPPRTRYTNLAKIKAKSINKFINYLHTVPKYVKSFKIAKQMGSFLLKKLVGSQFYEQCTSVALGAQIHVSEVVVFNYMYELGAYNDFCTSIPVQLPQNGSFFLARNLDYGYQEYLAENTVRLTFIQKGQKIVGSIGHAGLIGIHTGLRFGSYSATLNERIDGGLHLTLKQIFIRHSETVPYLLRKTLISKNTLSEAISHLSNTPSASAVYYILNGMGQNIIIEKQRHGVKGIYRNNDFFVQTNTDRELPDPDNRRTIAEYKVKNLKNELAISKQSVWQVLCQEPNKNPLTLITVILGTSDGQIKAQIWQ